MTGFEENLNSILKSGRRIKVLYFSISIFTSLHWAEAEKELFHAQMWGNRDSEGPCKTPKQDCIFFKG